MAGRLSACLLRKLTSTEVSNSTVSSPPKIEKPVTEPIKFSAVPGGSPRKLFRRSWLIPIPAAWHRRRGSHPARRSQRVQCQDGVNLRNLSHATRLRLVRQGRPPTRQSRGKYLPWRRSRTSLSASSRRGSPGHHQQISRMRFFGVYPE